MDVGGAFVTIFVVAALIGTLLLNLRGTRHLSPAGRGLTAAVGILLIAELWAAAYLWQRPGGPGIAAFLAAGAVVATLLVGFAIALRIDLNQRRDQSEPKG